MDEEERIELMLVEDEDGVVVLMGLCGKSGRDRERSKGYESKME